MKGEQFYIGMDFGTLSARAVLLDDCGQQIREVTVSYPHGVISNVLPGGTPLPEGAALADPADYRRALTDGIHSLIAKAEVSAQQVAGIGLDATSYSLVPCLADGTAMAEHGQYRHNPHAFIKLWKQQTADTQAHRIEVQHKKTGGFPVIDRYGGHMNREFSLPKLLETWEASPDLFREAARFCDLGEWLTWQLTGEPVNGLYAAGFKSLWTEESGYPSEEVLDCLSPGFGEAFYRVFAGEVMGYDRKCGELSATMAERLGLRPGIPISVPMGDGSGPGVFYCTRYPDALVITLGTSVAMAFTSETDRPVRGINGVVKDGFLPGRYCYDAGQPCAGDMLGWFVERQVPEQYMRDARAAGKDIHSYLCELAKQRDPAQNSLTVLDWWRGNRSILGNLSLRGSVLGYTLDTRPEDIYCAMLQSIACGMRVIVEYLEKQGITFREIIVCGGMAEKNPLLCQQYANILGRPIQITQQRNITAKGSAMLAAVAAGNALKEVAAQMGEDNFTEVLPEVTKSAAYEEIYQRYRYYHDLLSDRDGEVGK